MNKQMRGVSHSGTPFFLYNWCFGKGGESNRFAKDKPFLTRRVKWLPVITVFILFFIPVIIPVMVHAKTTVVDETNSITATGKVVIKADELIIHEDSQQLLAKGNVRVWYNDLTLTADRADADLELQIVQADGNVNLIEAQRDIKCAELTYDLKTRSAKATGILFATDPWYYQGSSVEKIGDNQVVIQDARFSTCNSRHPHFHLKAKRIDIVLDDALTAYDATLYIGNTPLFYLPWFRRSINDKRPPFGIKLGYNDFEGFFAKIKYNYFFTDKNYGNVNLDLMEKRGLGTGLDHFLDYKLLGEGHSEAHLLYIFDTEDDNEQITAKYNNIHRFSTKDELKINMDYLSNREFNREFSSNLVDSYQQKSSLYYNHRDGLYSLNIGMQENLAYDPIRSQDGPDIYYTSLRELPSLSLTLLSSKVVDLVRPVYFGMSSSIRRTYPRRIIGAYTDTEIIQHRYEDDLTLTPTLTQNYSFPVWVTTQPGLSWSLSSPVTGNYKEIIIDGYDDNDHYTELNAAYRTNVTLTNKWVNYRYTKTTHLLESKFSYNFQRTFDMLYEQTLVYAGITNHSLQLEFDYDMGTFLHTNISSSYNLLKHESRINWYDPVSNPTFSGRLSVLTNSTINWQGTYSWEYGQIDNGNISINHYGKRWNAGLNTSYSQTFNVSTKEKISESVFMNLNASVRPKNWNLGLNGSLQYDAIKNELTNFSIGITRDLHCWTVQGSFKVYQDGNTSIGFGMTIKAFPEMKIGMGGMGDIAIGE